MENKTLTAAAVAAVLGSASYSAQAALTADTVLDFTDGVNGCQAGGTYPDCDYGAVDVVSGTYFGMDTALPPNGAIDPAEKVAMTNAGGLWLGGANAQGTVDSSWNFGSGTGVHFTKNALTILDDGADGAGSIDMSGWTVFWNGGEIDMGEGETGASNGVAAITCGGTGTCSVGDTFVLDYAANVPDGGFAGVYYEVHMEGTVSAVPVPAAVWLFGSGLMGLVGVARRRKSA